MRQVQMLGRAMYTSHACMLALPLFFFFFVQTSFTTLCIVHNIDECYFNTFLLHKYYLYIFFTFFIRKKMKNYINTLI
jgi:hypothetical protein